MNLYIVGNGFDLYHGIPSKYADFANWLISNNPALYESMGKYYGIPVHETIKDGLDYIEGDFLVHDSFWRTFEEQLGSIDTMAFEEKLLDDLGLENDDPVDIGMEINADHIADGIKKEFARWIFHSVDTSNNYSIIRRNIGNHRLSFKKQSFFISFNYTHTLQKLYGIPGGNVFYIHGECISENSQLVVGHGNSDEIKRIKDRIKDLYHEYNYTQAALNRIKEEECMLRFISVLKKEIEICRYHLSRFLDKIPEEVDQVYSYGFSFGEVDIPYIKFLKDKYPSAQWHISKWKADPQEISKETDRIRLLLDDLNFSPSFFEFNNPNDAFIRGKITSQH